MEKFKKFELKKQKVVLGGKRYHTEVLVIYSDGSPSSTESDLYDDVHDIYIFK